MRCSRWQSADKPLQAGARNKEHRSGVDHVFLYNLEMSAWDPVLDCKGLYGMLRSDCVCA